MTLQEPKKRIEELFDEGILINKEMLDEQIDTNLIQKMQIEEDLLVLNSDYAEVLQEGPLVDWYEIDKFRVEAEKERDDDLYQQELQQLRKSSLTHATSTNAISANAPLTNVTLIGATNGNSAGSEQPEDQTKEQLSPLETTLDNQGGTEYQTEGKVIPVDIETEARLPKSSNLEASKVNVIISYKNIPRKYLIKDFTNFFISRYKFLEGLLRNRQELRLTTTINRVLAKKDREQVAIIGIISDIAQTKKDNLIITIEDLTGEVKVFISKSNKDLYGQGKDLVLDEVIGIAGTSSDRFIFADKIVWPDIPSSHALKKGGPDEYVIFLSDLHVGSKLFLQEEFDKFLSWLNGNVGSEAQREMAQKVKYVIIAGDLVDGIGIYPTQEEELAIPDIQGQYDEFTRLIKKIPTSKQIIICPGNHDAVHLAEPQPAFYQEFMPGLFSLPNLTTVTNPALVNIAKTDEFSGFDVLLYHGYSFDYYVANVDSIRTNGGYHRSDLIMKFLLKRRHLAPSFKSTPYYPSHKEDPLLIRTVPDFLITGHIHYSSVANYKGVTMISGSCWQAKTDFQEKLGHEPQPGRVPAVNLRTREIKVLRF